MKRYARTSSNRSQKIALTFNKFLLVKVQLLAKLQILVKSKTNKSFSISQFSPNTSLKILSSSYTTSSVHLFSINLAQQLTTIWILLPKFKSTFNQTPFWIQPFINCSNICCNIIIVYVPQQFLQNLYCYSSLNIFPKNLLLPSTKMDWLWNQKWLSHDPAVLSWIFLSRP